MAVPTTPPRETPEAGGLRLWSGTVYGAGFVQRLDAAVAGGFDSISMFPIDEVAARAEGLTHTDMRVIAADRGVRLAVLDPFCQWVPRWEPPPGMSASDTAFMAFDRDRFFAAAAGLGVESISVIEALGQSFAHGELVERFAAVCDHAADFGLRVHLEFMPFSGVPDLAAAWRIVSEADRPNGGLVFDFWHYARGHRDDALLAAIPGDRVFVVQVCDAATEVVGTLLDDSMTRRLLPGTGSFDTTSLLQMLASGGALGSVGAEVFSEDLWRLGPVEAGRAAGASLRRAMTEAGIGVHPQVP